MSYMIKAAMTACAKCGTPADATSMIEVFRSGGRPSEDWCLKCLVLGPEGP